MPIRLRLSPRSGGSRVSLGAMRSLVVLLCRGCSGSKSSCESMHFLGRERERIFDYVANGVMPLTRPGSKNQLDLGPHTPDAAIREIAIQEAARRSTVHTGLRHL